MWLFSKGKLDFSLVFKIFNYPGTLIICLLFICLQIFLGALRWKFILESHTEKIPFLKIVEIHWISLFFSTALPGGMTWDLAKVAYVKSIDQKVSKKFLFLSIFIDRLVGLSALLFVAGFFSIIFFKDLVLLSPEFKNIIYLNLTFFVISLIVLLMCCLNSFAQSYIMQKIPVKRINEFLMSFWVLSDRKKEIFYAFAISCISHLFLIAAFWLANVHFFNENITFVSVMSIIPIGLVLVALPIAPAGFGVGHIAFDKLFHLMGQSNGASFFNVFWIFLVCVNLCGMVPFIFSKNKFLNLIK